MSTTEKIKNLLDSINQDIEERREAAKQAMLTIERMSVSETEYKEANLGFGLNQFVIGYLAHVKENVDGSDEKTAENFIRFHAHYQHTKGNLSDGQPLSVAQATVAILLDGYVAKFFEA